MELKKIKIKEYTINLWDDCDNEEIGVSIWKGNETICSTNVPSWRCLGEDDADGVEDAMHLTKFIQQIPDEIFNEVIEEIINHLDSYNGFCNVDMISRTVSIA